MSARLPGHHITIIPDGFEWQAECFCGWGSMSAPTLREVTPRADHHMAEAANVIAARKVALPDPSALLRHESLALAQQHITRCPKCGSQVWDGDCGTCNRLARRLAKEVAA